MRGPCHIRITTEGSGWPDELLLEGATRALRDRLSDALITTQGEGGPWDLDLSLTGASPSLLMMFARAAIPSEVLENRAKFAELAGWVPRDESSSLVVASGLEASWIDRLATMEAESDVRVLCVDRQSSSSSVQWLPELASDQDRAALCASAPRLLLGGSSVALAGLGRHQILICGEAPTRTPGMLQQVARAEDIPSAIKAGPESAPPGLLAEGVDELDSLAADAVKSSIARDPEGFRRWAARKAEECRHLEEMLAQERDRRRWDRADLGEVAHHAAFVDDQYRHLEHARATLAAELEGVRASRPVRMMGLLRRVLSR